MSDYSQLLEDYRLLDEYVSTRVSPGNKDVPYLSGNASVGGILTVTMGNWYGKPTSYAYAWSGAGTADDAGHYTVDAADAGTEITCVVTATNPAGSTAAPASNAVAIPALSAAAAAQAAARPPAHAEPRAHAGVGVAAANHQRAHR